MPKSEGKHDKKPSNTLQKKKRTSNPLVNLYKIIKKNYSGRTVIGSVQQEFHCWLCKPNETLAISGSFFIYICLSTHQYS